MPSDTWYLLRGYGRKFAWGVLPFIPDFARARTNGHRERPTAEGQAGNLDFSTVMIHALNWIMVTVRDTLAATRAGTSIVKTLMEYSSIGHAHVSVGFKKNAAGSVDPSGVWSPA
ncbi:hypothetical protein R1flu_018550 [Riccia fluitans]|uniref:Uncharacterized protein n=1 Tax=Riccia fluitans TaxID=41844 RepID=A0ABD1ZH64_9MARC